ncbi:MAG: DUF3267 domain-containing protein [Methanococcaceae archaeon]
MTGPGNYKKEKLSINLLWANLSGILISFPVFLAMGLPFYLIWRDDFTISSLKKMMNGISPDIIPVYAMLFFLLLITGIILHELIHGIIWSVFAEGGFKSIKFGVVWKLLTPYCHCKQPLKVRHYLFGALMPALALGIVPGIISIIIGNLLMLIFGIIFTIASAGDFIIINLLMKENMDDLVEDHPSETGCYIYRKLIKLESEDPRT